MNIYRGYDIVKNKIVGCYSIIQNNKTVTIAAGNTVEDAMNKIEKAVPFDPYKVPILNVR